MANENAPPIIPIVTGIDRVQELAQSGGIKIELDTPPAVPGLQLVASGTSLAPWHRRVPWKSVAIVAVITLVVWWILSGDDPVETVKEVAGGAVDATKEVVTAATGG